MFDFSIFVTWLLGAVAVVGVIEWIKGFASAIKEKNWKSIALSLALPAVCFLVAFGKGGGDAIWNAFGMWSIAQLCYSLIVQSVQKAFVSKVAPALEGAVSGLTEKSETRPETLRAANMP